MTRLLQTLLQIEGYESLATPSPDSVVSTVREARPQAVVMDLHLGATDTLGIVRTLKTDPGLQSIPVIIVSGLDASEECTQAGADAFLLKPYSPSSLLDMIKNLVNQ